MDTNIHVHVCLCANKLNCNVQVAVFILIDRVKQQCLDGMRFRQNKPYHILPFTGGDETQVGPLWF